MHDETPDSDGTTDRLAAGPESPLLSPSARRSPWRLLGGAVAFVVVAAIIGGLLFKVPYVALVPGSARDTEPLVEVDGLDSFPSDGELLLTTVRVRQRPNLWEYLWLQADGDTDVVAEEVILDGRTPEENREFNLQLMTDSKEVAIAVALEQLGYDAITSDGVIVLELVEGAAAEDVIEVNTAITAIDDRAVNNTGDLVDVLAEFAPGDEIILTTELFDGNTATWTESSAEVVLGAKEDDPDAAFLGVGPIDRIDLSDDFDFDVDIDSGAVGGPSAGLAFTLAVLDQLTEGELTGGSVVAVTGTIDAVGRVGSVGGVVQKTAAVRDLGADVFIVPASLPEAELDRIRDRAGDSLQIIPVDDLDEALTALAGLGGEVGAVEEFAAANPSS
jgi:PDZ domain-containing protein